MTYPPTFLPVNPTLEGYKGALFHYRSVLILTNSAIIAVATTLISTVLGCFAGYSLASLKVGGENLQFWILSARFLPAVASILPLFLLIKELGLLDTYFGVILAHLVITLPYAVWMMRGFFLDVPVDLEDCAMTDGCSRLDAFRKVVLPLVGPRIAVTALFCFIFSWNEFMFVLILTRTNATTFTVLVAGMRAAHLTMWNQMAALAAMGMIPVISLSIIMQRYLVRGMTLGAVRG